MKKLIIGAIMLLVGFAVIAGGAPQAVGYVLAAPVVLPAQKIVFMTSLRDEYDKVDTWLNEASDLSGFVEDGQTLRFPEAGEDPEVYKNRTTDIDSTEVEETVFDVALDVYDTQNYKMRNINMHALPYEKISFYTDKAAKAIRRQEVKDAAYQFAPDDAGPKRIVLPTTGSVVDGFKEMTIDDVLSMAKAMDIEGFPEEKRNLVLTATQWWNLIQNNDILKGQLQYQVNNGVINPTITEYYGLRIHKSFLNNAEVSWDVLNSVKAPQGSVVTGDIVPGALAFCGTQVFRASGQFEMFMKNKSENTSGRAWEFGFQHRFKTDFDKSGQRYSAMFYQPKV